MREYGKIAFVSMLMVGLLTVPNLSGATDKSSNRDGDGRHRLLNAQLRSKVEHLRDKLANHREHQHNQGSIPGSLEALQAEVNNLKASLAAMANYEASLSSLSSQLAAANTRLSALEQPGAGGGSVNPVLAELAKYLTVDPNTVNGLKGPHVIFHGANVHVQSGSGATDKNVNPVTSVSHKGLGNLIVGYNEVTNPSPLPYGNGEGCGDRSETGSHNIVTGVGHSFVSYGSLVAGTHNCVTSPNSSILAGDTNEAHHQNSAILGGSMYGTSFVGEIVPQ